MKSKATHFKVGVTGGIGSGKTTVCKIIEKLGFPVFYSDVEAKSLMLHNPTVVAGVEKLFGASAYIDGTLNRPHLAKVVFNNPSLLSALNEIIHPEVRKAFENFAHEHQHKKLIFNEAAILFETGAYKSFDATILVTAPVDVRLKRVSERDRIAEAQVRERIQNQWTDDQKIPLADFVIRNEEQALQPQVEEVVNALLNKID